MGVELLNFALGPNVEFQTVELDLVDGVSLHLVGSGLLCTAIRDIEMTLSIPILPSSVEEIIVMVSLGILSSQLL